MVSGIDKLGFELSTFGLRMLPTQRACRDRGQVEIGKGPGDNTSFPAGHTRVPVRTPHTGNSYRERSDRAERRDTRNSWARLLLALRMRLGMSHERNRYGGGDMSASKARTSWLEKLRTIPRRWLIVGVAVGLILLV